MLLVFGHHVHDEMNLLLSFIRTIGALELRLLAAFPAHVIVQGTFSFVSSTAFFAREQILGTHHGLQMLHRVQL